MGEEQEIKLPERLTIAAVLVLLGAALYACLAIAPRFLFRNPSLFLIAICAIQSALFFCAGIGVMSKRKWGSVALGLSAAWYIAIFVATRLHGYVGISVALFLGWFLWDYNRFVKLLSPVKATDSSLLKR
jgi:hypothetical protein